MAGALLFSSELLTAPGKGLPPSPVVVSPSFSVVFLFIGSFVVVVRLLSVDRVVGSFVVRFGVVGSKVVIKELLTISTEQQLLVQRSN